MRLLVAGAALCSNARLNHPAGSSQWQQLGDPTEAALLVAALKAGFQLEELQRQAPRIREVPFDSHRRMMTVVLEKSSELSVMTSELENATQNSYKLGNAMPVKTQNSSYLIFTKGAPLDVLQHSRFILCSGQKQELTGATRKSEIKLKRAIASPTTETLKLLLLQLVLVIIL